MPLSRHAPADPFVHACSPSPLALGPADATFQEAVPLYPMVDKDGNHVILDSVSMRKTLV